MDPSSSLPAAAPLPSVLPPETPSKHAINPILSFLIGFSIIMLASILNAAGLNLTKLDHVRTSAIPKSARRKDWMRPLWLLGMVLYILSQLIGSTLALEYMRAEYVAPLGSSSLVFNFLFARFLVGTPITSTDIYGTAVVVLGVCGIVAFGSINSGLSEGTDVDHITMLWRRSGWLGFFFFMSISLIIVLLFTYRLDAILTARSDISAVPFSANNNSTTSSTLNPNTRNVSAIRVTWRTTKRTWLQLSYWLETQLEAWAESKDDKNIAWTLGISWACCGGGLAGGTLVFAKAVVKLLSGSLSHENGGNQFGHAAPIFTIILLAVTAVLQIVCLNRGLKVYDSTLVVPVFYGVYTATGFLNSLIFNNQVDAYQSWTLFLIFVSIAILICGVVLLTHKKPEPGAKAPVTATAPRRSVKQAKHLNDDDDHDEEAALNEGTELWAIGNDSDGEDEDVDHHQHPIHSTTTPPQQKGLANDHTDEGKGLIRKSIDANDEMDGRPASPRSLEKDPFRDTSRDSDEFGSWADVPVDVNHQTRASR